MAEQDFKWWFFGQTWVRWFGAGAMTFMWIVFVATSREQTSERLIRHEQAHIDQGKRYGHVWFSLLYTWEHFRCLWKTKSWWGAHAINKYENEARAAENPPKKDV